MERLEAIEHLIEESREEAPRIVAERSREAVEALEAGIAAVVGSARDRLRPEPRRPRVVRMLLILVLVAAATAVIGWVLPALVQRGRRWLRRRQAGASRRDFRLAESERASGALERPGDPVDELAAARTRVAVPVAGDQPSDGAPAVSADLERVSTG